VYDKTVRRRRAVLALLVGCSLILLTAYFRESAGGGLHSVQRGVSAVFNPLQDGTSRALKPVRDLYGWFGDTLSAKGDVKDLRDQRDSLRTQVISLEQQQYENVRMRSMLGLDKELGLGDYRPVTGRVIQASPTVWYATIRVNKGSNDGVRMGQPVINEQALIGRVTEVFGGAAQVTLITDATSAVSARAGRLARQAARGVFGIVQPASAGNPNDLLLKYASTHAQLNPGDPVVTRGTVSDRSRLESPYPAGIPIGAVTRIQDEGSDSQEVHLRPFANMHDLDFVQILTRPHGNG
jgi:rod shape-determining protein MreC